MTVGDLEAATLETGAADLAEMILAGAAAGLACVADLAAAFLVCGSLLKPRRTSGVIEPAGFWAKDAPAKNRVIARLSATLFIPRPKLLQFCHNLLTRDPSWTQSEIQDSGRGTRRPPHPRCRGSGRRNVLAPPGARSWPGCRPPAARDRSCRFRPAPPPSRRAGHGRPAGWL